MSKRVAVIDIGSNSLRMLIYEKTSRFAFHILHEAKSKVRLPQNAYANGGNLQEAPMQRAFFALKDFASLIDSFKVRKTLCVATSALRDAPNKSFFISKIRNDLGINIKIIDGTKEAYLGAMACLNLLPKLSDAMTIDIGGGSTEFAHIDNNAISNQISLELGTVRLKELFFDKNDIDGAKDYIDAELSKLKITSAKTLVGIGGTFRAISSAIMDKEAYPIQKLHGYEPDIHAFEKLLTKILNAKESELYHLGIKEERFDVIKPGALILLRVLKKLKTSKLLTSGVGIREGVFLSDLLRSTKDRFPLNFNTSIRVMLDRHIQNRQFSSQISKVAKSLFDQTHTTLGISSEHRKELAIAAKIYTIGSSVHFYSQHSHNYELVKDMLEFGFSHKEIMVVATLVKYGGKKMPPNSHIDEFKKFLPPKNEIDGLVYILSLSIALLSHRPKNIDFECRFENDKLNIITKESLYLAKQSIAKIDKQLLEITFS